MCGIFGIVARNSRIPDGVLERATQSLAHRGPDDSGTILLRDSVPEPVEIGLGNRRLAILDLSPLGHQPMRDVETGNWIVYNGEIYNFRDIRDELEEIRHELRQPLRHRSRAEGLRALGRGVSHEISRHVCLRALGCAPPPPFHRSRSHGHQAALLCAVRLVFSFCLGSSHVAWHGLDEFSH